MGWIGTYDLTRYGIVSQIETVINLMSRWMPSEWLSVHSRPRSRRHGFGLMPIEALEGRTLLTEAFDQFASAGAHDVANDTADAEAASFPVDRALLTATSGNSATDPLFSVIIPDTARAGQLGLTVSVTVSPGPPGGYLDGWIDWNGDGNYGGANEHVVAHSSITSNLLTLRIDAPAWARPGLITARFQRSTATDTDAETQEVHFTLLPPTVTSGQFGVANPVTVLAAVQFTAAADLDRDGDMDLLSATFDGDGTIAWHENTSNENFIRHIITTAATEATCVIPCDMNGDGYLDVVCSSLGNSTIAWFENDGQQQFSRHVVSTSASRVSNIFVADLDGDDDPDIVSTTKGDNAVAWYQNDGLAFTKHVITTSVSAPCSVSVADLDRDGDLDVIVASFSDNTVSWYANDGSEIFTKRIIATNAGGVRGMFVADLDGDGDQDIVASCLNSNKIAWYENDGGGTFTDHNINSVAPQASAVSVADMDGDGDLDVLGGSRGDTTLAWFENIGTHSFPEHIITTSNIQARGVIAADVDGDGDLDVVSATKYGSRLAWYQNLAENTPLTATIISTVGAVVTTRRIPITITFNLPIEQLTADMLIPQNGTITNFSGSGSSYSLDLNATTEGAVSLSLPAGVVTDIQGSSNLSALISREFVLAGPVLSSWGGTATFVRNSAPIAIAPAITVTRFRGGGGTLLIVVPAGRSGHFRHDAYDDSLLNGLGTVVRATTSETHTTTVKLDSSTTAEDVQAALRGMTFRTSRAGLNLTTRQVRIKLTDTAGQSQPALVQMILVARVRRSNGRAPWAANP